MNTAVVFGGNGEIGRAITKVLKDLKFDVVVADLKIKKNDPDSIEADLTLQSDVKRALRFAHDRLGKVEVVVNCQGFYHLSKIEKTDADAFNKLIDINLKSVFLVCKEVIPTMKMQKKGYIINLASMAGLRGREGQSAYCASKFGVVGLTESLFEELKGTGVRISAVCPTSVNTGFLKDKVKIYSNESEKILKPHDVARVIAELVTSHPRVFRKIVDLDIEISIDKVHRMK